MYGFDRQLRRSNGDDSGGWTRSSMADDGAPQLLVVRLEMALRILRRRACSAGATTLSMLNTPG
jgi:hypothetical protein